MCVRSNSLSLSFFPLSFQFAWCLRWLNTFAESSFVERISSNHIHLIYELLEQTKWKFFQSKMHHFRQMERANCKLVLSHSRHVAHQNERNLNYYNQHCIKFCIRNFIFYRFFGAIISVSCLISSGQMPNTCQITWNCYIESVYPIRSTIHLILNLHISFNGIAMLMRKVPHKTMFSFTLFFIYSIFMDGLFLL